VRGLESRNDKMSVWMASCNDEPLKPIKILLIEDNVGDVELIKEMLGEARNAVFHMTIAGCLIDGLRDAAKGDLDVILLDPGLPDSQGRETVRAAVETAPNIPIIVLTGQADEELALDAVRLGAQDYLHKGQLTSDIVERSIRYSIERKRADRACGEAYKTYQDIFQGIPSAIITYKHDRCGGLVMVDANPQAMMMFKEDLTRYQGMDLNDDLFEIKGGLFKEEMLKVMITGQVFERLRLPIHGGKLEGIFDVKAFRLPRDHLCIIMKDVTRDVIEEEWMRKAYDQLERNTERFAHLVDGIRNPASVIMALANRNGDQGSKLILQKAEEIESSIKALDEGWLESENIMTFLRKHH
jgi:CheY-like chemotaxis protein